MRYASFSLAPDPVVRLGAVRSDGLIDLTKLTAGTALAPATASLLALVDAGPEAWDRLRQAVDSAGSAVRHPLAEVRWHAPIQRPRKNIMCLGLNYAAHARESAAARGREARLPEAPVIFTKAPTTVNGPFGDIAVDRAATSQVDWEVELAVIVGRTGRNIPAERALEHLFGYTALNDVTARDLQQRHGQFFKGKSLDGFCPMGPTVVTADEFGDPQAKRLTCRVNGVVKQDGSTGDMIFPVRAIVEWLSKGMTIEAGDIIATGTPEGVGMGRTPQEFLHDGDLLETEVQDIGVMRNRIVG
jgi:2-keto-4-pentenoate hydratase/2-oxohepta-3-ene-1,7-dioic acid hydratase in catechol pathway